MAPPPLPDLSPHPLMNLPLVRLDSRILGGLANNQLLDAAGFDATVKLSARDGSELASGKCGGMTDPSLVLDVNGSPWLEARCNVKKSPVGPVESLEMDEWQIVDRQNNAVLGVCNFRTFRDQALEFYDWFSSLVKDETGNTIGGIKGIIRFRRLVPLVASISEKRFRIFRHDKLLAIVALPPRLLERLNPFRLRALSQRMIIRFQNSISDEERMFVYGVCLVNTRTPL